MALERARMFEPGQPATIEVNGLTEAYPTRIEDVRTDYLLIATPMKQREYVPLDQGKRILLSVIRRNSPYFFDTVVIGPEWSDGQQYTQVRRPPDNAGVALRAHVRVPVTIADASFWIEGDDGKFGPTITGSILDISAGGLQALTRDGLPEGSRVLVKFQLSRQAGSMMANVVVIRNYETVSDVGVKRHRSGCKFIDLPDKERDRLIKFVFAREGELRRRGVV